AVSDSGPLFMISAACCSFPRYKYVPYAVSTAGATLAASLTALPPGLIFTLPSTAATADASEGLGCSTGLLDAAASETADWEARLLDPALLDVGGGSSDDM